MAALSQISLRAASLDSSASAGHGSQNLPTRVGDLGDGKRLVFVGNRTFTADAIRDGLRQNPDFLLDSHPAAPFAPFLESLQSKIIAGYQFDGFRAPEVTARFEDRDNLVHVQINEGQRYRAGEVRIHGTKTVDPKRLVRRLTESYPPPESTIQKLPGTPGDGATDSRIKADFKISNEPPFQKVRLDRGGREIQVQPPSWNRGKPVSFVESSVTAWTAVVTNALAEAGCLFPKVRVALLPNTKTSVADLAVEILDEGPKDVVDQIDVVGNERNSREEIIRAAGLKPGVPLDENLIDQAELALWSSGRFLAQSVTPVRSEASASRIKLRIEVVEQEGVPPLSSALSPEEQSLIKLRDWLAGFQKRDEDLVVQITKPPLPSLQDLELETLISPRHGLILTVRNSGKTNDLQHVHYLMLNDRGVEWCSPGQGIKVALTNAFQAQVIVNYTTLTNREAPSNFAVGTGFQVDQEFLEKNAPPFKLETLFAPAAFLHLKHGTNLVCKIDAGKLVVSGRADADGGRLEADATSGRLLGIHFGHDEVLGQAQIRFERGVFDRRLSQIAAQTAAQRNVSIAERPVSSLAELFVKEVLTAGWFQLLVRPNSPSQDWSAAASTLSLLLNARTLGSMDAIFAAAFRSDTAGFSIPLDLGANPQQAQSAVSAALSAVAFRFCDDFFPRGSFPWTIAREAVFVIKGQAKYTDAELERLYNSDTTGPVGCLILSKLLDKMHSPAARLFATRGLVRLDVDHFRHDYQLALGSGLPLAQTIRSVAGKLTELNPGQLDPLVNAVPAETGRFIREAAGQLDPAARNVSAEGLAGALDDYWERSLKDQVRAQLLGVLRSTAQAAR